VQHASTSYHEQTNNVSSASLQDQETSVLDDVKLPSRLHDPVLPVSVAWSVGQLTSLSSGDNAAQGFHTISPMFLLPKRSEVAVSRQGFLHTSSLSPVYTQNVRHFASQEPIIDSAQGQLAPKDGVTASSSRVHVSTSASAQSATTSTTVFTARQPVASANLHCRATPELAGKVSECASTMYACRRWT
jgi:hypothetical protein